MPFRSILLSALTGCLLQAQAQRGFVENLGQWPAPVTHRAEAAGVVLWCEPDGVLIDRYDAHAIGHRHGGAEPMTADPLVIPHHAFRLRFIGAGHAGASAGQGAVPGTYSYFIGNDPDRWASGAQAYTTVVRPDLYPGIDLLVHQQGAGLKYDLVLAPGSDPDQVLFRYEGVEDLRVQRGAVRMRTRFGELTETIPLAYQDVAGERRAVPCHYRKVGALVGFTLGTYDPELPLVIDPTLDFSTYSGSTSNNFGYSATFDAAGFLYAGSSAFGQGYPTTVGAYDITWNGGDGNQNSGTDIALTKFDTSGTSLIWSTFIGGSGDDLPHSLIVNDAGELIVLGTTGSPDHPTTANAFDATFNGGTAFIPQGLGTYYPQGLDMVLARLSADGSQLLAATYIGGTGNDGINSAPALKYNYADEIRGEVLLDATGRIIVASCTQSTDFPTTAQAYSTAFQGGSHDAVLFRLDPGLTTLQWSTFLGGSLADAAYAAEVDDQGRILITGGTSSTDLPTTPGTVGTTYQGGTADAFVCLFSADGSQLLASSYYGSPNYDQAYFVELDDAGAVYLLGQTLAPANALVANAEYVVPDGGQFLVKLSADLGQVQWASRFGALSGAGTGRPNISPTAFLVDHCDKIYITGWGSAIQGGNLTTHGLPHSADAFQSTTDGNDFYLVVFDIDMQGTAPVYATFFGGAQSSEHVDGGTSRFDRRGRVYQAVCAGCGGFDDFPIEPSPGAWSAQNNNSCNLGVFKFDFNAPLVIAGLAAPDTLCAHTPVVFHDLSHLAAQYHWDFGDGTTSDQPGAQHTYAQPGTYTVTLTVSNSAACNEQDTDSILVTVLAEAPFLEAMGDTTLCGPSDALTLVADGHGTAQQFIWTLGLATAPLNPDPTDSTLVLAPPVAGTYHVQAFTPGSCVAHDQVVVRTALAQAVMAPDAFICADQQAVLQLQGIDAGATVQWTPQDLVLSGQGTTQATVAPTTTTTFHATATLDGCTWTDSVEVFVSNANSSEVQAHADPDLIAPGTLVQLSALPASGVTYVWSPAVGLSDPTSAAPTVVVNGTTTFTVTVSNGVCTASAQVTVKVAELRCEEPEIFIPDAFTPNGDGNNDVLFVRGRPIRSMEWKIFDRWGELVFESTSLQHGWDGTFEGRPVDPAVFVYWLKAWCIDDQEFVKKGNVTVIR